MKFKIFFLFLLIQVISMILNRMQTVSTVLKLHAAEMYGSYLENLILRIIDNKELSLQNLSRFLKILHPMVLTLFYFWYHLGFLVLELENDLFNVTFVQLILEFNCIAIYIFFWNNEKEIQRKIIFK